MIIFPAIDIRGGKCVRLTEGRFDQETIFADKPLEMAKQWVAQGAQYLHLVDLDGALKGASVNTAVIKEIVDFVDIPVQLGGGIRTIENIEHILSLGITRVILGSVAVKNPELVKEACQKFGDKIVVGIDAKNGEVAVEGWGISGGVKTEDLAKQMSAVGVERIIFTDISRDGPLTGVNVEATAELAKLSGLKIIASGGVSSLEDIKAVKAVENSGVEGVIVGKAIYTGAVDLPAAIKIAQG